MSIFRSSSLGAVGLVSLALASGCGGSVAQDTSDTGRDTGVVGYDAIVEPIDSGIYPPIDSGFPPPLDAGSTCVKSSDHVEISVTGARAGACMGGAVPKPLSFDGRINAILDDTTLQIDTCPPTADCMPLYANVTVKAPGLSLYGAAITGSLVHVDVNFVGGWACTSSIVITSLSDWDGEKNPVDIGGKLYVAAAEGMTTIAGVPFKVGTVANGCLPGAGSCGGSSLPPDLYSLRFTSASADVVVPMGTTTYSFAASGQPLQVRNLRSFYDGACDAYWDYAWWAAPGFLPD